MTTMLLTKDKFSGFFDLIKTDLDLGCKIQVEITESPFDDNTVRERLNKKKSVSFDDSLSILGIKKHNL